MPRRRLHPDLASSNQVNFSNVEKMFFPEAKFTKGDLLKYYADVAEWILPHLKNRPVTLIRFPDGRLGQSFYEKNAPKFAPKWVKTAQVNRRHHEGSINYLLINDVATLLWCANLAAIELHPFLHRFPAIAQPTSVAFDLDPGEGADLLTCIKVATLVRELMRDLKLECFPKVSGSKGLQLYVPLNTKVTYDMTAPFAKAVAEMLEEKHPDLVVSKMAKVLRRGKVMIDWSQNNPSKTTVSVYSMRAKRDTPYVSMPVTWEELAKAAKTKKTAPLFFTPDQAIKRLRRIGDLFAPVLTLKQKLPAAFRRKLPKAKTALPAEPSQEKVCATPKRKSGANGHASAALRAYEKKRDFSQTKEPSGRETKTPRRNHQAPGNRFVIQKHAASHLHFDFRLEMNGTMKSWAVPKGLPYELGVKRSAFEVEDHPLDYMRFEGTIPKGQYGGGTVMVWDIGTYEIIKGSYQDQAFHFLLHGKKLKGEWMIFRIRSDDAKPVWLIAKGDKPMKPLSARQEDASVLSRRSMARIASDNDAQWHSNR